MSVTLFVSGAYLENRLTNFNHITHTWSPHALDVPFGVYAPLKGKRRSKKVVTCHVVSGAYLEKSSTDFNRITQTWSPHAQDVPFVMHNLFEGQRRSIDGCNLSCRFRSISRKPLNEFQPYYTHMIPICPRCACRGARPSRRSNEGQSRLWLGISFPEHISKTAKRISTILHTHEPHKP
jgi:hypothetical protein